MGNELAVIPLEKKVEQEFKLEIVKLIPDPEAAIAKLKENYMTIKVTDKASFKKADEGRKDVKNFRVMGEKVCDAQRADLEVKKKAWIKKKEDWGDTLGEIEDYLIAETEKWKQAEQKRKDEEAEKLEAEKKRLDLRLLERQQELGKFSVLFSDNTFMLGEVRYSYEKVREADDEEYQNEIYPAFKAIFDQHEEERRQQEIERQEQEEKQRQEAEQLRQEQEQLRKDKIEIRSEKLKALDLKHSPTGFWYKDVFITLEELGTMLNNEWQSIYDVMKTEVEDNNRKQEERKERERIALENIKKADVDEKFIISRLEQIESADWDGAKLIDRWDEVLFNRDEVLSLTDFEFNLIRDANNEKVANWKLEVERKRQEEEEQKRVEAERKQVSDIRYILLFDLGYVHSGNKIDLALLSEEEWNSLYSEKKQAHDQKKHEEWLEQEKVKKQQEGERKAAQLAEAKDKEKWQEIMTHLEKTPILEMRSQQYRTKMKIVRDFLADLKAK